MQRDNIWDGFVKLFPNYVDKVESYKKIGSKSIKLKMKTDDGTDKHLIFLYNDPWDWTLGTKVWRAKPRPIYRRNNIDQIIKEAENKEDNKNV